MLTRMFLRNPTSVGDMLYVEDVFSTYLYAGADTIQSIVNGIDLAGSGGMVWIKSRPDANLGHFLFDTNRGTGYRLASNSTAKQSDFANNGYLSAFNNNGFTLPAGFAGTNASSTSYSPYVSWTFRKSAKFFDVVSWTGNSTAGRQIAHNLGTVPSLVIVKRIDSAGYDWICQHNSFSAGQWAALNTTNPKSSNDIYWNNTLATSSVFTLSGADSVNQVGGTYVAYLFAHDTTGVVQGGSYTGNGSTSGPIMTLGWEPQWLLVKNVSNSGSWQMLDVMRGMPVGVADATLQANSTAAESIVDYVSPNAVGFQVVSASSEVNASGDTYIYVAIRRPMKTPTTGASVFNPLTASLVATGAVVSSGVYPNVDAVWWKTQSVSANWSVTSRITGNRWYPFTATPEAANTSIRFDLPQYSSGQNFGLFSQTAGTSDNVIYSFRRASGFLDIVCYTGTGATRTVNHNLGVAPEFIAVKRRDASAINTWVVYATPLGATRYASLTSTSAFTVGSTVWNDTEPTSSVFTVGTAAIVNTSGGSFLAYLFASCPGVSKVGSYTGNGTSQTVNCGFSSGARFIMIRRSDSTGAWYVFDSARGIVPGNDPNLRINSTASEAITDDTVDTAATGFVINQDGTYALNTSGATYLYLAIA